jgi:hypothetical protein
MASVAILAFFSPCNFDLPQRHLLTTVKWLLDDGLDVVVSQVCRNCDTPQYVPPAATSLVYRSEDVMFFKENLWNLAARQTDADTLFFFDADVVMSSRKWLTRARRQLETHDVIQPYEIATWLDRDGLVDYCRPPSSLALAVGKEPAPGKYHPGFAWGMRRQAYDALNGWYDLHPAGGGDTGFAYANYQKFPQTDVTRNFALSPAFWECKSFLSYCDNARSQHLSFGIVEGVSARHLWHGDWRNRGYVSRNQTFKTKTNGEYPVHYRDDGLLAWDFQEDSICAAGYFASRKEDG